MKKMIQKIFKNLKNVIYLAYFILKKRKRIFDVMRDMK
jgi:hypothetical protein